MARDHKVIMNKEISKSVVNWNMYCLYKIIIALKYVLFI